MKEPSNVNKQKTKQNHLFTIFCGIFFRFFQVFAQKLPTLSISSKLVDKYLVLEMQIQKKYFTSEDKQKVPQASPSHNYQIQVRHDVGHPGQKGQSPLITTMVSRLDTTNLLLNRNSRILKKSKNRQYLLPPRDYLKVTNAQYHQLS